MTPFGPLPTKKPGPITKALTEAIALRKQLLAGGMPEAEADAIVGKGLKAVLGHPRANSWRFYCDRCRDTGWVSVTPDIERMERLYGPKGGYQDTLRKCEPCRYLERERSLRRKREGGDDDDFVAAGHDRRKPRFS